MDEKESTISPFIIST